MIIVKIVPNDRGNPPGKLADAELHFTGATERQHSVHQIALSQWGEHDHITRALADGIEAADALAGLKLIGFAIWQRRGTPDRNVTFPARQYSINGERRSFALLRPILDASASERIRDLILDAYTAFDQAVQS